MERKKVSVFARLKKFLLLCRNTFGFTVDLKEQDLMIAMGEAIMVASTHHFEPVILENRDGTGQVCA